MITGYNSSGQTVTFTYTGSFYTIDDRRYGTITSITGRVDGSTAFSATGLDVSVTDYANSDVSFLNAATSGNDSITSSSTQGGFWNTTSGDDTISAGTGNDTVYGGSGTDTFVLDANSGSAKFLDFFGSFTPSYSTISVQSGYGTDYLRGVELLRFQDRTLSLEVGSYYSDTLTGDQNSGYRHDVIAGGSGNDTISGLTGADRLYGNAGSDRIAGGAGGDRIFSGSGDDRIAGGAGDDRAFGNTGNDAISGGRGRDLLSGGGGHDTLAGGEGADRLLGGRGSDLLVGGSGNDDLFGGEGRDTLLGHQGDDLLTGGAGRDVFLFHRNHGNDTISDFELGIDRIEIGRGASRLGQLDFEQQGEDVLVSFSNVTILVEDVTLAQLQDADNFLF
ncbi:calcium-binding protein [Roseobacteraceae bacterium NS-SX3]